MSSTSSEQLCTPLCIDFDQKFFSQTNVQWFDLQDGLTRNAGVLLLDSFVLEAMNDACTQLGSSDCKNKKKRPSIAGPLNALLPSPMLGLHYPL
jgi:hypothetical protein